MTPWRAGRVPATLIPMRPLALLFLLAAPLRAGTAAPASPAATQALDALWPAVHAAARAWPGYGVLDKPLLLTLSDGSALLIEHPAPPLEFRRIMYRGMPAYFADSYPPLDFTFRIFDFAGAKVMAVRQNPNYSGVKLVALAIHERFHDHQSASSFNRRAKDYSVEDEQDVALAALENRSLAEWIGTGNAASMRDFAALRLKRRALNADTGVENAEENLEGTARYVQIAAQKAAEGAAAAKDSLIRELRDEVTVESLSKTRLYGVGAALSQFLESRTPGAWQPGVEAGRDVSQLALDLLALTQAEADARAARLTAGPEYAGLLSKAGAGVTRAKARRDEFLKRFRAQAGRKVVVWDKNLRGGFSDKGDWFKYPDGSLLHEWVIEWVVSGPAGRLRLTEMLVLEAQRGGASVVEFFAGPDAVILVDGKPWYPSRPAGAFRTFSIRGKGVELTLDGGRLESCGDALCVVPSGD